ncbi:MAG: hypothetical protein U0P45_14015 [Acidimicrobiales bacterium]
MSDDGGALEPEPRRPLDADDLIGPIVEVTAQEDLELWGDVADHEAPDDEERELPDDDTLLRMTYELRSQVDDTVVGIIRDEDWDRLVTDALDQFPWEG